MIFQSHIPRFPLSNFIEVLIYFEGVQHAHNVDRLLPNGETEILIDFNDGPQYIYDNYTLEKIQACHHVWAAGLRTEPITIPAGSNASMMVISFKKGRAYPFYPVPVNEVTDIVVDSELIWGRTFVSAREEMLDTRDIGERFRLMEDFLLSRFRSGLVENPCVSFAVSEMVRDPGGLNIAKMNAKIGYSQKHFTAIFKRHVGITPKGFVKIVRFQKAVAAIEAFELNDVDWAEVSQYCGFYDQSHFIHDFKHFSGFTPEHFSKIRTNYRNYIPVG